MSLRTLYDEASLWMTPSGYEDGKLFSELPTDGSGDFTFSRGSNLAATRVGPTGLIEKGRENLLVQSNQFDTTWTNYLSTETSGQIGYDGSSDAWLLTKSDASGQIIQSVNSNGVATFSVYAKANASNYAQIVCGSVYQFFDLSLGALAAGNGIGAAIEAIGTNGWYRCSVSFNSSITSAKIYPAEENTAGATSGSIYIQDAQLEAGLVATDYIETGASTAQAGLLENEPRLDYSGGATCPSLLLEPSRTNLLPYSEYFEGYSNAGATFTTNSIASPEGVVNATTFEGDGTLTYIRLAHSITFPSAGDYTISVFAKAGNNDFLFLNFEGFTGSSGVTLAYFDLSDGTTPTSGASIEAVGTDGWYRCSITATIDAGDLGGNIVLLNTPSTSGVFFPTAGDANGKGVEIYGLQAEAGSYPTSYIPTYGSSVTRSADACNSGSLSSTFDDSQGVLFVEFNPSFPEASSRQITINDSTYSNRIILEVRESATKIKALLSSGGSATFDVTKNISVVDTTYKVAIKYSATDTAFFVNGEKVASSTGTIAMPTGLEYLSFTGRYNDNALAFESRTKQLAYFPTALTDSECIKLTTI